MPFLHGFRRIIYEYQPLVDAVMCVVGLEAEEFDQRYKKTRLHFIFVTIRKLTVPDSGFWKM